MRLLLATNRGPFLADGRVGDGGLVTSVLPVARSLGGSCFWLHTGGPDAPQHEPMPDDIDFQTETLALEHAEVEGYYRDLANGLLWPLFHELTSRVDWRVLEEVPGRTSPWHMYQRVNERVAARLLGVGASRRNGRVLFAPQDYHLMLVPQELRRRAPEARIGWLSYIPFPSPQVLAQLPRDVHVALLEGLLGADLLGFQVAQDAENFLGAVDALALDGVRVDLGQRRIQLPGRDVRVELFPLAIDTGQVRRLAAEAGVQARHAPWRARFSLPEHVAVLLNIARLDYTKGIPESLEAYGRLLRREPRRVSQTALILVAPASRSELEAYHSVAVEVDARVAALNAEFSGNPWPAVCYVREKIELPDVVALCSMADVGVITPLKDGMNLVAHEFVAAQASRARPAALVLSKNAGAAQVLRGALQVDPTDLDAISVAIAAALDLPDAERRARMQRDNAAIEQLGQSDGVRGFFHALEAAPARSAMGPKGAA